MGISLAVRDAALAHVVGTEFDLDLVAGKDADEELPHLAADVRHDLLAVLKADLEARIGQGFGDFGVEFDLVLFGHALPSASAKPRTALTGSRAEEPGVVAHQQV